MLDALMRRIGVVAQPGADAGDFVRRNRRAHPAAADQDGAFRPPVLDGRGHRYGEIRIIRRLGIIGAAVDHLMAKLAEEFLDVLFERKARMIRSDGDTHAGSLAQRHLLLGRR